MRKISTPCCLRKWSKSSFLPPTPSVFQLARPRALRRFVVLRRVAIFGHENGNGLEDRPRATCSCEEGADGHEEPMSQLYTCWEGKVLEEI